MKHLKKFENFNHSEVNISGIKCDNSECDYRDDSVSFDDYPNWVNKECPKCGQNLLTQEDYDECLKVIDAVDIINHFSPDDLEKLVAGLSEEEMDGALDMINKMKLTKRGNDSDGREIWASE